MQISVIASGSNGNSCLLEDKDTSILVDAGKSGKEIESRMNSIGRSAEDLDGILVTHSHQDHIAGAGVLSRRYYLPLYMTRETCSECSHKIGNAEVKNFSVNRRFRIGSMTINPVLTSHNVSSCGFVFGEKRKFGLFTDTGCVTKQMTDAFRNLNGLLLESNHDIDMVANGPYPAFLKKWILSERGHLSNPAAASLVQELGGKLGFVLLGHLSGNNNTPETAEDTFERIVKRKIDYTVCSRECLTGSWSI
ncbi:MAG: MBL fold metallo-hydrolase [Candidatus Woesearchaeota archaeon]